MLQEMESEERERLSEQSNALRQELKAWEKDYASKNDGRKAGREDIKQNGLIADKYKEYSRLRDILSGKLPLLQTTAPSETPKKRKQRAQDNAPKRQRITKTPSKTPSKSDSQPWEVDLYESPSFIRHIFTPSKKLVIGPTPQKDGQVLGIFDLLQEESNIPSPSGKAPLDKAHLLATPRKTHDECQILKHSRTPASSSKRRVLDMLATPLKDRQANGVGWNTPSSISKMATPSFLKRHSQRSAMPAIPENEGLNVSPELVRPGPRRPLVRSLSSMLASLRKMEDDAADDDLEALREMESEADAPPWRTHHKNPEIQVPDSQNMLPLGGFDDEAMLDSEPEEKDSNLGPHGKLSKVWKKKGQKRTTRRVKMRPSRSKPVIAPTSILEESDDEIYAAGGAVRETQLLEPNGFEDARNFDSDSHSEYTASEGGTRYKRPKQNEKGRRGDDSRKEVKKRKANTIGNQNFKRLKLRNSGAKGGPGQGSRFRRRK